MNKKELAEVEALKTKLALRFYPCVAPDIDPPVDFREVKNGYTFNSYSKRVEKACTGAVSHCVGSWDKTTSQNSARLYSSRKLAYMAMLHEMSIMYANDLREVERRTENDSEQ